MQKQAKKEWAKEKQPKFNDGTLLVEEKTNCWINNNTHEDHLYGLLLFVFC
nr:hypothetical protein [Mycoplasmopsis bovis]